MNRVEFVKSGMAGSLGLGRGELPEARRVRKAFDRLHALLMDINKGLSGEVQNQQ